MTEETMYLFQILEIQQGKKPLIRPKLGRYTMRNI